MTTPRWKQELWPSATIVPNQYWVGGSVNHGNLFKNKCPISRQYWYSITSPRPPKCNIHTQKNSRNVTCCVVSKTMKTSDLCMPPFAPTSCASSKACWMWCKPFSPTNAGRYKPRIHVRRNRWKISQGFSYGISTYMNSCFICLSCM